MSLSRFFVSVFTFCAVMLSNVTLDVFILSYLVLSVYKQIFILFCKCLYASVIMLSAVTLRVFILKIF